MAKPQEHELTAASKEVWDELRADIAEIAGQVWGRQGGPDGVKLPEQKYVDYFIRGWTDPDPARAQQFWQEEFQRIVPLGPGDVPSEIGMDAWEALIAEVQRRMPQGYVPPPAPPPAQVQPGGMGGAPPVQMAGAVDPAAMADPMQQAMPTAPPMDHAAVLSQIPPDVIKAYLAGMQSAVPPPAPEMAPADQGGY